MENTQKPNKSSHERPFDPSFHEPGSLAASGACSWHGVECTDEPLISFVTEQGRQSGCRRAVQEVREQGRISLGLVHDVLGGDGAPGEQG